MMLAKEIAPYGLKNVCTNRILQVSIPKIKLFLFFKGIQQLVYTSAYTYVHLIIHKCTLHAHI